MLGQRVINNMLGNKPKADRKSKNNEYDYFEKISEKELEEIRLWAKNECPACGSYNIQKVGSFRECRECGLSNYGVDA